MDIEKNKDFSVLVVDDELEIRKMHIKLLERLKFGKIFEAGDVKMALIFFNEQKIDLIITDLHMIGQNGFTLIRILRQTKKSDVPLILATSAILPRHTLDELEDLKVVYLRKPLHMVDLREAIKKAFALAQV